MKGPQLKTEVTEERVRLILENREKPNGELSDMTGLSEPIIQMIKDVNSRDYDRVSGLPEESKSEAPVAVT